MYRMSLAAILLVACGGEEQTPIEAMSIDRAAIEKGEAAVDLRDSEGQWLLGGLSYTELGEVALLDKQGEEKTLAVWFQQVHQQLDMEIYREYEEALLLASADFLDTAAFIADESLRCEEKGGEASCHPCPMGEWICYCHHHARRGEELPGEWQGWRHEGSAPPSADDPEPPEPKPCHSCPPAEDEERPSSGQQGGSNTPRSGSRGGSTPSGGSGSSGGGNSTPSGSNTNTTPTNP